MGMIWRRMRFVVFSLTVMCFLPWIGHAQSEVVYYREGDLCVIENDYIIAEIDLAHGGALTWLRDKELWQRADLDIADNFRIQVVVPNDIWIRHGGPGFPPNPATIREVQTTSTHVVINIRAGFKEEVTPGEWRRTANSEGVLVDITYYFFNSRMFFVNWVVRFAVQKDVERVSIEAIPVALPNDAFPHRWAYCDREGDIRTGRFRPGWNWIEILSLGEYWLDTWSNEIGFGRIILDVRQLEPGRHVYLCAQKPVAADEVGWTGHVDAWLDGRKRVMEEGHTLSAMILYTVHPGDYTYMQRLYQKLQEEPPPFDLKSRLESLEGLEEVAQYVHQLERAIEPE